MKRSLTIAALLLCGCLQMPPRPVPDDTVPGPTPVVVVIKATRADLCEMLAAQIVAGHIDTTDELVRVLGIMSDAGQWSEADSAAVDAALPGLTAEKRALTADDAAKLKAVK